MKKTAALALPALLAAAGAGFEQLYKYVFCKDRGVLARLNGGHHQKDYYQYRDEAMARLEAKPRQRFDLFGCRGKHLAGFYYMTGERPSGKIAFIVHGYHSDHREVAGILYDYYASRGFDIFGVDLMSHGESEGEIIGYDYYDSVDCLSWIDFLKDKFGEDIQIALHGFSMGGATVLKMSDSVPECVKFIVSDSGYNTAQVLMHARLGPLYHPLAKINDIVGGYAVEETDVRPNLMKAKVPVLFVHGKDDPTVPFEIGEELFNMCPTEKDSLFIEGARHIECWYLDQCEYEQKLDSFIDKYIKD